jgi:hypothetical protein
MKHQVHYFIRPFAILLASLALVPKVQAAGWQVIDTIVEPTLRQFGYSIAISKNGRLAAVTQSLERCTDGKAACGAVCIYTRDQKHWQQQAKLFASDAVQNTQLGGFILWDRTVSLNEDGTVMAVASRPILSTNLPKPAVYLFVRKDKTWYEQQKITLPTELLPAAQVCINTDFGRSLALSADGKSLVVAAGNECLAANTGAVYVFKKIGAQWLAQARLVGSHDSAIIPPLNRNIGYSVDISGDGEMILFGSPGFSPDQQDAYVFVKKNNTWTEKARLTPADAVLADETIRFGAATALSYSGKTALVWANGRQAVYVYNSEGKDEAWQQEDKLQSNTIPPEGSFNQFGFSLDLDDAGKNAVIGDFGSGEAFLYTRNRKGSGFTWQPQKLLSSGLITGAQLSTSITISGDAKSILVSDPFVTSPRCGKQEDGSDAQCAAVYTLQK